MPKERVLRNVPESDLDQVVKDFESEGCSPVVRERQQDGNYTVRATCPDEQENSSSF